MKQYKTLQIGSHLMLEDELNKAAQEGWEMKGLLEPPTRHDNAVIIMEREAA